MQFSCEIPNEIASEICIYSKNVREKLIEELNMICGFLINNIKNCKSNIETNLNVKNDNNRNSILKESVKQLKSEFMLELIDTLNLCWENCILLYQIEDCILTHPLLTYKFDYFYKENYNNLKRVIANETFITKRMLECFLSNNQKIIFLDSLLSPKWITNASNNYNFEKNVFSLFSVNLKKEMIDQIEFWINQQYKIIFSDFEWFNAETEIKKKWEKIDGIWIFYLKISDKEIIYKYNKKMKSFINCIC